MAADKARHANSIRTTMQCDKLAVRPLHRTFHRIMYISYRTKRPGRPLYRAQKSVCPQVQSALANALGIMHIFRRRVFFQPRAPSMAPGHAHNLRLDRGFERQQVLVTKNFTLARFRQNDKFIGQIAANGAGFRLHRYG